MYKQEISRLKRSRRHAQNFSSICLLFLLAVGVSRAGHAGLYLGSTGIVRNASTVTAAFLWSLMSPVW